MTKCYICDKDIAQMKKLLHYLEIHCVKESEDKIKCQICKKIMMARSMQKHLKFSHANLNQSHK